MENKENIITMKSIFGLLKYKDNNYLVLKNDKFIVKPIVIKQYAQKYSLIFVNKKQLFEGQLIENYLNSKYINYKIRNISDILKKCKGTEPIDEKVLKSIYNQHTKTIFIDNEKYIEKKASLKKIKC